MKVLPRDKNGGVKGCKCEVCKSVREGPSIVKIVMLDPDDPEWRRHE